MTTGSILCLLAGAPPLPSDSALCSDMAAFKAANPGAELSDFLSWRCPSGAGVCMHAWAFLDVVVSSCFLSLFLADLYVSADVGGGAFLGRPQFVAVGLSDSMQQRCSLRLRGGFDAVPGVLVIHGAGRREIFFLLRLLKFFDIILVHCVPFF